MKPYTNQPKRRRKLWIKTIAIVAVLFFAAVVGGIFAVRNAYDQNLKPVSSSEQSQLFTVPEGASVKEIAASLQDAGLIRAAWAFEWYVRNHGAGDFVKAGTYNLRPNLSVPQIVGVLTEGKIATDLVTILPGQTLEQIKQDLIRSGFREAAVETALNPANYTNHPALVDKPRGASLEGYLYPESFQKTAETTPKDVIRASLDEMSEVLTPEIRDGIVNHGLTVYEGITLASLVEREVSVPDDRRRVAQVFLRRLREDIPLQSDVSQFTYNHKGLPPAPVSNVSSSSLSAVVHPAATDFLYFVSGDDGRTHFSHTLEQHEANVNQYCTELCQ